MRKAWRDLRAFYGLILPRASDDTFASLGLRPVVTIVGVILGYPLAFFALTKWRGAGFALDQILVNGVLSAMLFLAGFFVLFLYNVAMTPPRLMKDYRRFEHDSRRLALISQHLRPRRLEGEDRVRFQKVLEGVEPRPVIIEYLATQTSLANPYASDLVDVFLSLKWQAGARGETRDFDRQGVSIYRDGNAPIWPAQKAVMDGFQAIGVPVGTIHSGDRHVADRVELFIGELPPYLS